MEQGLAQPPEHRGEGLPSEDENVENHAAATTPGTAGAAPAGCLPGDAPARSPLAARPTPQAAAADSPGSKATPQKGQLGQQEELQQEQEQRQSPGPQAAGPKIKQEQVTPRGARPAAAEVAPQAGADAGAPEQGPLVIDLTGDSQLD